MRGETRFTFNVDSKSCEFTCNGTKYRVKDYWAEFECCVLVSGDCNPSDYEIESMKIVNWGIESDKLVKVLDYGEGEEDEEWLPEDMWVDNESCDECKAFLEKILCDKQTQYDILDYARTDGGFNLLFEWE